MKPTVKPQDSGMEDLFRSKLKNIIHLRHELVRLGELLDWALLEARFAPYYKEAGRPGLPIRLLVGLHLLKHIEGLSDEAVYITGQKRGVTDKIKRWLKRRSVVEPVIGHAKNDGLLGRNWLKGRTGDRCNTLLAAAGFNLRQVLRFLKRCQYFLRAFFSALLTVFDLLPLTQATI